MSNMRYWAIFREGNPDPLQVIAMEVEPTEKNFSSAGGYKTTYTIKEVLIVPIK